MRGGWIQRGKMDIDAENVFEAVKHKYNFDISLKKEQVDVLNAILHSKDVVGILPTGFGKSLRFALPPIILDEVHPEQNHIAVVISPLLSLMEDQKIQLQTHSIKSIIVTNETAKSEISELYRAEVSIIFTSPELLQTSHWRNLALDDRFKERLCLLVCDEAHCVSEWGESFRPEFREIPYIRSIIDSPKLALTATATEKVEADIFRYLVLDERDTVIVTRIPDRPNIFLDIRPCSQDHKEELAWYLDYLKSSNEIRKTLIFCRTYAAVYSIWSWIILSLGDEAYKGEICAKSRIAEMFHSSTDQSSKDRILADFTSVTGNIRVLVCTVAFGMGVNIPDIYISMHLGAPKSVFGYWQEVGRGDRAGQPSVALQYPYKRSLMKTVSDDDIRELVSSEVCLREQVLKQLLTKTMKITDIPQSKNCEKRQCHVCECSSCCCCIICQKKCQCVGNISAIDRLFI